MSKEVPTGEMAALMRSLSRQMDDLSKTLYTERRVLERRALEMKPWDKWLLNDMMSKMDEVETRLSFHLALSCVALVLSCVAFALSLFAACS